MQQPTDDVDHGPASTAATYGPTVEPRDSLHAEGGEEIVGRVHAEHHEVALREIDHAHDAEDEGEADAHQAVDGSDRQTGGHGLKEIDK